MTKQTINIGAAANDGTGDPARTAFTKTNSNFDEVYKALGATDGIALPGAQPIAKGGTGAVTAANARSNLGLGTASTSNVTQNTSDTTLGAVLRVGDYGIGAFVSASSQVDLSLYDIPAATYITPATGVVGLPAGWGQGRSCVINFGSPYRGQLIFGCDGGNINRIGFRSNATGTIGSASFFEIYSKRNTTVDANGFIKAASPIVQLFADKIELNDEAKLQNITFEKNGIGDYLIKGSAGFSSDGWYIEQPKDANGNVLVAVVYEQLENDDISVKTYKKKFDLETASIIADLDNPMDIPEGRWIDIRLHEEVVENDPIE